MTKRTLLVAEIGINANGDMNIAKQLIDAAILGGCNFVKFQKRTIDLVYTREELDRYRKSPWGTTNRLQKEGLEFSLEEYKEIDKYCKKKGIEWFASPWDIESVKFLKEFNVPFIKIASASITDIELLKEIKRTNIPVIISTGMSSEEEINNCLSILEGQVTYILSCTSNYPAQVKNMNMNKIDTLKQCYGNIYKIGFSNHSPSISFILMAYVLGAEMIEYHITLDRSMYGSDQASAIETKGMIKIREYIEAYKEAWGSGKIECLPCEVSVKEKLRKK